MPVCRACAMTAIRAISPAGKADAMVAYTTNEPFVLNQLGAPYQTFSPRSYGIDFYGDSLCTSARQVRSKSERVRAFAAASLKGWQYALSHKEEIVDLILQSYAQEKSRDALLFEANPHGSSGSAEPDPARPPERAALEEHRGHLSRSRHVERRKRAGSDECFLPMKAGMPDWLKYTLFGLAFAGSRSGIAWLWIALSWPAAQGRARNSETERRDLGSVRLPDHPDPDFHSALQLSHQSAPSPRHCATMSPGPIRPASRTRKTSSSRSPARSGFLRPPPRSIRISFAPSRAGIFFIGP